MHKQYLYIYLTISSNFVSNLLKRIVRQKLYKPNQLADMDNVEKIRDIWGSKYPCWEIRCHLARVKTRPSSISDFFHSRYALYIYYHLMCQWKEVFLFYTIQQSKLSPNSELCCYKDSCRWQKKEYKHFDWRTTLA